MKMAELIAKRFLQQFDLFCKIDRARYHDILPDPLVILNQTVEETRSEIEANKDALDEMEKTLNGTKIHLTFFELKLRQSEWLNQKESKMTV